LAEEILPSYTSTEEVGDELIARGIRLALESERLIARIAVRIRELTVTQPREGFRTPVRALDRPLAGAPCYNFDDPDAGLVADAAVSGPPMLAQRVPRPLVAFVGTS
jgi:hypothetical protein